MASYLHNFTLVDPDLLSGLIVMVGFMSYLKFSARAIGKNLS